jgi:hypothetical protein
MTPRTKQSPIRRASNMRWLCLLALCLPIAAYGQDIKTEPIETSVSLWQVNFTAPLQTVTSWSLSPQTTPPTTLTVMGKNGVSVKLPPGNWILIGQSKTDTFDFVFNYRFTLTGSLPVAPPTVTLAANPEIIQVGQYSKLLVTVSPPTAQCTLDGKAVTLTLDGKFEQIVTPSETTEYTFTAKTNTSAVTVAKTKVTVGTAPQPPPDPVNPPVPTSGLFCLIVEETADRSSITAGQREILLATAPGSVRDYLTQKCVKGPNGVPEFRVVDKDNNMGKESDLWKKAWARPRTSIPWICVSNGKDGFEGPLPKTAAECLDLLKKYGG